MNGLKQELQYPNQKQMENNMPGSTEVNASKKNRKDRYYSSEMDSIKFWTNEQIVLMKIDFVRL